MDLRSLVGRIVTHTTFGDGIIVDIDAMFFTVDFGSAKKKFLLKTADQFFSLAETETGQMIQNAQRQIKEEIAAEKAAQHAAEPLPQEQANVAERLHPKQKEPPKKRQNNRGLDIKDGVLVGLGTNTCASITIPDHVTTIGKKAFSGDIFPDGYVFKHITIPDSVTSIEEEAFLGCYIEKLTIGTGLQKTGYNAFNYCSIDKVNYLGTLDQWTQIHFNDVYATPLYSFGKFYIKGKLVTEIALSAQAKMNEIALICNSPQNIVVDDDSPVYKTIDGNLYSKDGKVLIKYATRKNETEFVIPASVTEISMRPFCGATSLKSIVIGRNLKDIAPEAFIGCNALESINYLGTLDEWMEIRHSCCTEVSSNEFPDIDLYINGQLIVDAKLLSARHIRECSFRGCRSLKTVVLSNTVTSIEERAFRCCPQLTSIRIPDSVTFIESDAFDGCEKLTIYAPAGSFAEKYAKANGIPFVAE